MAMSQFNIHSVLLIVYGGRIVPALRIQSKTEKLTKYLAANTIVWTPYLEEKRVQLKVLVKVTRP